MLDIFEGDVIYGSSYQQVGQPRPFNSSELSKLNANMPAEVFQGQYNLSCRIFVRGSNSTFYCKSLDKFSAATDGDKFDITKCFVTQWKKPDSNDVKIRILVPADAIL